MSLISSFLEQLAYQGMQDNTVQDITVSLFSFLENLSSTRPNESAIGMYSTPHSRHFYSVKGQELQYFCFLPKISFLNFVILLNRLHTLVCCKLVCDYT